MKSLRKILIFMAPLFLLGFIISTLYKWNYIQHEQKIPDEFNIPYKPAGVDHNKNRIDDGKDILQGAKDYTDRSPQYETLREYDHGWPEGKYGSNGDVVAQAFLNAGYDLQVLMNQDISKNPDLYKDVKAGKNIAFRDPKAQEIYFSRYATSLTTDIDDYNEWQPGDVIFFEKDHCAIVADKVNNNRIRFIIHHFWQYQAGYFQDVLETGAWGKITGHYRVSERLLSPKTSDEKKK